MPCADRDDLPASQFDDPPSLRVDVLLDPEDLALALREDVRRGLTATPKQLPPKWFYDDRGCELFEAITRLPEYYPTETERGILAAQAGSIAGASGADTIVELGSGRSDKTRTLLDAFEATGQLRRFVPFEVNESTVRASCLSIAEEYPGLAVHAVVGDFERHLSKIPRGGRRMIALLGSTIGHFVPAERTQFLTDLADGMSPGDSLLLGTDLVKDIGRLEAAYDDSQGITAEFNLNVLRVMNRELGSDFDLDGFSHRALFDPDEEWIEMRLVARHEQHVWVKALHLGVHFDAGEEMRTEISAKFRREGIEAELAAVGLDVRSWMTDPGGDFALSLAVAE